MFTSLPLHPEFHVEISATPIRFGEDVKSRVEILWNKDAWRPGLRDEPVLSLITYSPDLLTAGWTTYRYVHARQRFPEWFGPGNELAPLAVTGLLICADGLVLGRRGPGVTNDVGLWEPAPSGGLAQPDPTRQVLLELEEELGLLTERMRVRAFGVLRDDRSGTVDILFRIDTELAGSEIVSAHRQSDNDEYSELMIVPIHALSTFIASRGQECLDVLSPMLLAGDLIKRAPGRSS
jgi:hypothetical protein